MSALYAFYENKASKEYKGADYDRVMAAVDKLFDIRLSSLSDAVSDGVFGRNDKEGIKTTIIASFGDTD